jgi:hypothetical protein
MQMRRCFSRLARLPSSHTAKNHLDKAYVPLGEKQH